MEDLNYDMRWQQQEERQKDYELKEELRLGRARFDYKDPPADKIQKPAPKDT